VLSSSTPVVVASSSTSSIASSPTVMLAATTSLPPYAASGAAGRQHGNIGLAVLVGGLVLSLLGLYSWWDTVWTGLEEALHAGCLGFVSWDGGIPCSIC
jgi:hypothetical protein